MAGDSGEGRSHFFFARLSFWVFAFSGALTSFLGWAVVAAHPELGELRLWEWQVGGFGLAAAAVSLLSGFPAAILGWRWRERGYPRRAAAACAAPPLVAALLFASDDVAAVETFLITGGPALGCALWSLLHASPRRWKTAATIVLVAVGLLGLNGLVLAVEGALVRSADSGDLDTAELILKSGFDVEARNLNDRSPLMAAVEAEDAEMVLLLLDWQASPYRYDASGDSPMLRSIELRSTAVTVLMLDYFAAEPVPNYEIEESHAPFV